MDEDGQGTEEDGAYSKIREAIVEGRLAPGTKIIARRLGERLEVSRTTVRVALVRLWDEGFVERRNESVASFYVGALTLDEVRELVLLLSGVEKAALEKIVTECDGNANVYLAAKVEEDAIVWGGREGHRELARVAGGSVENTHERLFERFERYLLAYNQIRVCGDQDGSHRAVGEALMEGKINEGKKALECHWEEVGRRVERVVGYVGGRGTYSVPGV